MEKVRDFVLRPDYTAVVVTKRDAVLTVSDIDFVRRHARVSVVTFTEARPAGPGLGEPIPAGAQPELAWVRGDNGKLVLFSPPDSEPGIDAVRLASLKAGYERKGIGVLIVDPEKRRSAGPGLARVLGAETVPEAFLFDHRGKLVYRGAVDNGGGAPNYLHDALEALLARKPIAVPRTLGNGREIKEKTR